MSDLKYCAFFQTSALELTDDTLGKYHGTGIITYDGTGLASQADVADTWIVYMPARSLSTGGLVAGTFLRFAISAVVSRFDMSTFKSVLDFDLTWDEATAYSARKLDPDLQGVAVLCEASTLKKLGYVTAVPPSTAFGINMPDGTALSSRNSDIDKIIDNFGTGSADITFNGSRMVKRSGLPAVNAGGATITEWLNNYFFPFLPATVTLNGLSTYQYGTSNDVTLTGAVVLNDETTVYERRVYDVTSASTLLGTVASNAVSYTVPSVVANRSFKVDVDVAGNGTPGTISSPVRSVSFVYPFLYGMTTAATPTGSELYTTLTKLVEIKASKTVSLTGSSAYIYFAYPDTYGQLTAVYDQNGFDTLASFTTYQISVVASGLNYNNWTTTYRVYRSTSLTAVATKPFVFTF